MIIMPSLSAHLSRSRLAPAKSLECGDETSLGPGELTSSLNDSVSTMEFSRLAASESATSLEYTFDSESTFKRMQIASPQIRAKGISPPPSKKANSKLPSNRELPPLSPPRNGSIRHLSSLSPPGSAKSTPKYKTSSDRVPQSAPTVRTGILRRRYPSSVAALSPGRSPNRRTGYHRISPVSRTRCRVTFDLPEETALAFISGEDESVHLSDCGDDYFKLDGALDDMDLAYGNRFFDIEDADFDDFRGAHPLPLDDGVQDKSAVISQPKKFSNKTTTDQIYIDKYACIADTVDEESFYDLSSDCEMDSDHDDDEVVHKPDPFIGCSNTASLVQKGIEELHVHASIPTNFHENSSFSDWSTEEKMEADIQHKDDKLNGKPESLPIALNFSSQGNARQALETGDADAAVPNFLSDRLKLIATPEDVIGKIGPGREIKSTSQSPTSRLRSIPSCPRH